MDTRRLQYFVTIVDAGTITRAAEMLHLAQPALSQHVASLENEFGHQLLVRSRKGVEPTAAGQAVYRYALDALRLESTVRKELDTDSDTPSGTVMIGLATFSIGSMLMVPILQAIRSRYPRIVIRLVETLTVVHSQAIRMGQLDAALIFDPGPVKGVRFDRVSHDELCLVTPAEMPVPGASAEEVPLSALGPLQFLLPPRSHTLRRLLESAFRQNSMELDVVVELEHMRPLGEAISLGLGVTVLPRPAAEAMFAGGEFAIRRIVEPTIMSSFTVATRDEEPRSPAIIAVTDVLHEFVTMGAAHEGEQP
ncbi:LysR family nitrogen assimilation transcriptional regulator [Schumannella luteola]|uniref:LysR family nitrogen assimilation transcriptional regulator n=1 Tax=Schumannella luteola TaxID=472059 RepID=A0A852Y8X2_9MICO|nr:LysR substrate-binding domain-containing protein [Schumannella luteola]NYG97671.1 LysR family nitrogen assimilation transcriptional regulator [Schumannella luteola]